MSNSGRQLENLVEQIESALLPYGFTVESRKRIFNDDGVQIAEFDIQITGNIGSAPFKMLIECRDRPSDGPAPASWIEQLVGRRIRFKFDKIIAVSSTGFAPGAKGFADQSGIELRLLTELDPARIVSWFLVLLETKLAIPVEAKVYPIYAQHQKEVIQQQLQLILNENTVDTPLFISNANDEFPTISLKEIWIKVVEGDVNAFIGLRPNGPAKYVNYAVIMDDEFKDKNFFPPGEPAKKVKLHPSEFGFCIKGNDLLIRIVAIAFRGKFRITHETRLPDKAYQYSIFQDKNIASMIQFDLDDDEEAVFIISQNSSTNLSNIS